MFEHGAWNVKVNTENQDGSITVHGDIDVPETTIIVDGVKVTLRPRTP